MAVTWPVPYPEMGALPGSRAIITDTDPVFDRALGLG